MVKRHPIGLSRSKLDFARRGLSNGSEFISNREYIENAHGTDLSP